jgi:hypothetical protein
MVKAARKSGSRCMDTTRVGSGIASCGMPEWSDGDALSNCAGARRIWRVQRLRRRLVGVCAGRHPQPGGSTGAVYVNAIDPVVGTRSGAAPLNTGWVRRVCELSGRRPARRTVMLMRSGSSGRSRKKASIASSRSANGICGEHYRSSPRTIIASAITKVLRTS